MSRLGDILELMYVAHRRAKTIRAEIRLWADTGLVADALSRWAATAKAGSTTVLRPRGADDSPRIWQRRYRVWHDRPGRCWRVESHGISDAGLPAILIINGSRWWRGDTGAGFFTNVGAERPTHTDVDDAIRNLLDPASIIPLVELGPADYVSHAGRRALRVLARPRTRESLREAAFSREWPYADEYELLVDAEQGVLLRYLALLDSKAFVKNDVETVSFDEEFLPDLFVGPANATPFSFSSPF